MQEQDHGALRLATAEPENRPEERQGRPAGAGARWEGLRGVILRGAAVLLDMLAWWPEALLAGQTCLAALEVRQGEERE
jgi:hypothetical protein